MLPNTTCTTTQKSRILLKFIIKLKLNFLGSALYIAAHPDDENTRLIAYLANEQKLELAIYLTRGDGQNLIGTHY
jgi:hypothetical protein